MQPGDFSFINPKSSRMMYEDMHSAVTKAGLWEQLKHADPGEGGFMFGGERSLVSAINENLKYPDVHSGASFAVCLRTMQYIAVHGWDNYKTKCTAKH